MAILFRSIAPEDNKEIAKVIRTVLEEHGVNRPGTVYTDPTTDQLSDVFETPGSNYWIAEENGNIIGGCGIYPTIGLPNGCAELVKLYVAKSARGKKVGSELIRKSIESARDMGYTKLYLESMPELTTAVTIYENLGFKLIPNRLGESGHFACDIWMVMELTDTL